MSKTESYKFGTGIKLPVKTVSFLQVIDLGWDSGMGRVKSDIGDKPYVVDRIVNLWAKFGKGPWPNEQGWQWGPLHGHEIEPWIYFTKGDRKYRTPLY